MAKYQPRSNPLVRATCKDSGVFRHAFQIMQCKQARLGRRRCREAVEKGIYDHAILVIAHTPAMHRPIEYIFPSWVGSPPFRRPLLCTTQMLNV